MAGIATAAEVASGDTVKVTDYDSDFFAKLPVQEDYQRVFYRVFPPSTR